MERKISRGDVYYADLNPVRGSEQGGIRPVLVVQNNVGNRHSPTVIVVAITARMQKHRLPTHVKLNQEAAGLARDSVILCEQIRTIDKTRLKQLAARLSQPMMDRVDRALKVSLAVE
ncbi:type II toxin-antitoxin system PemK/MazF family toxin [Limosilactobacillus gorillae]|jgi:mRNA interferase MazF|uniref:type II toxin-antitoxin system PemK/MazF family toxin n=1 Tax=Limosilactobacillus gorillae TaxID=1450649 RepID=UPI000B08AC63|nr:type II toxin-antitoxin system PemK/MazF family toxin [Limosilactobacillus gorillae]